MKSENAFKVERLLVVGPKGLRLLLPETHEEIGYFPYARMKEFSQNFTFKLFQFAWFPSKGVEEVLYFQTSKSDEIQQMISQCIKELLVANHVKNPDEVINRHTFQRTPEVDKIRKGGRQRSISTGTVSKQKKVTKRKQANEEIDLEKVDGRDQPNDGNERSNHRPRRHVKENDEDGDKENKNEREPKRRRQVKKREKNPEPKEQDEDHMLDSPPNSPFRNKKDQDGDHVMASPPNSPLRKKKSPERSKPKRRESQEYSFGSDEGTPTLPLETSPPHYQAPPKPYSSQQRKSTRSKHLPHPKEKKAEYE